MTHDLRVKIKGVLGERYPAEVQGCDAKKLDHIGARKVASYLKLGDYSFEAVRFALQDFPHRVSGENSSFPSRHCWRHLNNRLALMPFSSASFEMDIPGLQEAATSFCLNSGE